MTVSAPTTISSNGKYYQCVEKTAAKVSVKWKVFHVTIFLTLALNAFITAWSFGHILSSSNFNCILHSTLYFNNKSTTAHPQKPTTEAPTNATIPDEETTSFTTELPQNQTEKWPDEASIFKNETFMMFENETYYLDSKIDWRRSRFSNSVTCDLVLFVPLISMIFSAVLGVVLAICSKGGAGYANDIMTGSQNMVYPMLIISGIFAIINAIASYIFVKGLNAFCENFEVFTGTKKCNYFMDIFTIQFKETKVPLFHYYLTTKYTFYIGIALWCFQIAVNLLRFYCFADYDLYNLEIKKENYTEDVTTILEDISLDTTERTTKV